MTPDPAPPHEITRRLRDWSLAPDGPVVTTRSSWILPVRAGPIAAVLKVARVADEQAGYRLMAWWDGDGAARVLVSDDGALLLERGAGVRSLAHMARTGQDDLACRILCQAAARLHAPRAASPPDLHPLDRWFAPLFELAPNNGQLAPAAEIARELLAHPRDVRPLHGDLHHDNVLDFAGRGWLAIDPHGLLGERTFDFANIFTNPDLGDPTRPVATRPGCLETRLRAVTEEAGVEAARMLQWIVAWTGLSAAWFLGDGDRVGAEIDLQINASARRLLTA